VACYGIGLAGAIAFFLVERWMGAEALLPLRLFTNKTVGVASIASVVLGMGMFGGLACLPLYLQIVKGATPTSAGLMLLPMTLGMMGGSIISGQIISRTGQYRQFPIIGCGLLIASLFGFHYVGADTPLWQMMILMLFFGLGLGGNMQPLTLAVQNAVSPRDIGVATSSATFTRQIGGTLGTAIFLSILFSTVPDRIATAFRTVAPTPGFQAALRNPQTLTGSPAANTAFIHGLPAGQGWRSRGEPFERLLVHPAARPTPGQAIPDRLLPGDGPGVPDRRCRHGDRVRGRVVPATCGAPKRFLLREPR